MRRWLDRLYYAAGAIGACFVLIVGVLMIGQSVLREFGVRTGAVNDIVAWCCAAASFFAMAHAFKHGDFVRVTLLLDAVPAGVRRVLELASLGSKVFPVVTRCVDDVVTVTEAGIVLAMRMIWERMKIVVEPSSAVPLAGILEGKVAVAGRNVGIILTGGNVAVDALPWHRGN